MILSSFLFFSLYCTPFPFVTGGGYGRISFIPDNKKISHSLQEMMVKLTGIDITRCPCCLKGKMQTVAQIPRHSAKHPYGFIRPPNFQACAIS